MRHEGSDPAHDDLARLFGLEHEAIDDALAELLAASRDGDSAWARRVVARIERQLLEHLHAEETQLFPPIADDFPEEVAALLAAHTALRRDWATIAASARPSESKVAALRSALHAHGREEELVYAEAERRISPFRRPDVIARTRHRLARRVEGWDVAWRRSG
jgi:hypothetical protein